MAGRKPKPTALKLVTGNPGRRPLNKREPKPKRVIPAPPAHLSERALLAWGSLATRLDRVGVLTELDALALEQLCENYAEILELRADIKINGRFQLRISEIDDRIERVRPAQTQLADAERRFKGMMAEFGMTPSSRSRLTTANDDDAEADPAKKYFSN